MKYELKQSKLPAWHFDPATNRQLKVLRFFGHSPNPPPTKGAASAFVTRTFFDPANKHLWQAYVYTTGDEDDESADLQPHDRAALASVIIPDDWRPKRAAGTPSSARKALEQMVADILKDGSPFDDPLPDITISGTAFCFTGTFAFGKRKECEAAVIARGGAATDGITRKTDVLVIASDASPRWAHGSYGTKICDAMVLRMQYHKPTIIPEAFWVGLLDEQPGNA